MANQQSMCTSFMGQLLSAGHNFNTTNVARTVNTVDNFKAALYLATATINAATTAYTATGEVTSTNYAAGGIAVTNATAPIATNSTPSVGVAYWTPSASLVYGTVGLPVTLTSFDTVLIYNSSQANAAVSVHTFGTQTVTSGVFTLTMPANGTTTALLRLATS